MDWKPLLKSILAIVLAAVYSALKAKYPDFPLVQSDFIEVVLWAIGGIVGGWQTHIFINRRAIK